MGSKEVLNGISTNKLVPLAPQLKLPQLDHLDRETVTIQCINSSDFVIGKQTNFNGPVTIISCAEVLRQGCHDQLKPDEEKVVIEDKVLSQAAAMKVQKMAAAEEEKPEGGGKGRSLSHLTKYLMMVFACVGLLTIIAVALLVVSSHPAVELGPNCTSLPGSACIYSGFSWGGRPVPEQLKPLKTPVPYIVISQTNEEYCYDVDECLRIVKIFQLNTTNKSCNFLLGGDGNAYEDRGWHWENSLEGPARGKSLLFCFVGKFSDDYPTYPQFVVAKTLIQFAVDENYASKDYLLFASNVTSDDVIGPLFYTVIKKWAHFVENPFPLK